MIIPQALVEAGLLSLVLWDSVMIGPPNLREKLQYIDQVMMSPANELWVGEGNVTMGLLGWGYMHRKPSPNPNQKLNPSKHY